MSHPPRIGFRAGAAAAALVLVGGALLLATLSVDKQMANRVLPHGYCFTWQPGLLAMHVISDSLIGLAYVSIPLTLMTFVRRRNDIPFNWIAVLFAIFIISCGLTHLTEIWTIWNPDYWTSGLIKALTASASVPTAIVLIALLPKLVALPTAAALEAEVNARRAAEAQLREERDLLERRVAERTQELEAAQASADQARLRAEAANTAKDRFLASVSHELRTPLQGVLGWTQVLSLQKDLNADAKRAVERLQSNVSAQARLINDLLDISRIISGKLSVNLEVIDCRNVIERAIDSVRTLAEKKNIALSVDSAASHPIETDGQRLQQVLWNLLTNAINASTEGGAIKVICRLQSNKLCIDVQDAGIGIAPGEAERLFEAFRQGQQHDGPTGGLGLGLAISRSIVHLLGGQLTVASEGLGRGSTFTVALPVADASSVTPQDARVGIPQLLRERLRGKRLLFVEDEPDILESQASLLRTLGIDVTTARNFDEAQQAFNPSSPFDVVISDVQLGAGGSGLDLAQMMRSRAYRGPMLAMSAYGRQEDIAASSRAGFDEHLTKPVDVFALARRIAQLLG